MGSPIERMQRKEEEANLWLELHAVALKVMQTGKDQKAHAKALFMMGEVLAKLDRGSR
jgi:hypothetical protein